MRGSMASGGRASTTAAVLLSLMMSMGGAAVAAAETPRGRQEVIDQIVAASAKITVERAGKVVSSGSGVVVDSGRDLKGEPVSYVLTAAHVLDARDAPDILVQFMMPAAGGQKHPADLVRRGDPDSLDLALLRVRMRRIPADIVLTAVSDGNVITEEAHLGIIEGAALRRVWTFFIA